MVHSLLGLMAIAVDGNSGCRKYAAKHFFGKDSAFGRLFLWLSWKSEKNKRKREEKLRKGKESEEKREEKLRKGKESVRKREEKLRKGEE
ncbi:hypothetical protein [Hallella sp.]|uniref:hypothetical protein n=1 Tax=Hallella sp. TaxID=2980186 RepID=UPI00307AE44B